MSSVFVPCAACGRMNRFGWPPRAATPVCGQCREELPVRGAVVQGAMAFSLLFQKGQLPLVALFWKPGRGEGEKALAACTQLAPKLVGKASFVAVNVSSDAGLEAHFGLEKLPAVVLFLRGKEIERVAGPVDPAALCRWIETRL